MIVIVDYGMGNLRSVQKGLEKVGVETLVTSDPKEVKTATGIVLPGVGAFRDATVNLKKRGLDEVVIEGIRQQKPFLGICLGLQLLFEYSEEGGSPEQGYPQGFGIIKGEVVHLPRDVKVPHIGWNLIHKQKEAPLLQGVPDETFFYFVHSYYARPKEDVVATTTDYGLNFASSIWKDNIFAIQFHPEKSSEAGLKILENFGRSCR